MFLSKNYLQFIKTASQHILLLFLCLSIILCLLRLLAGLCLQGHARATTSRSKKAMVDIRKTKKRYARFFLQGLWFYVAKRMHACCCFDVVKTTTSTRSCASFVFTTSKQQQAQDLVLRTCPLHARDTCFARATTTSFCYIYFDLKNTKKSKKKGIVRMKVIVIFYI